MHQSFFPPIKPGMSIPGQFLDVKGQLTGNTTTITKVGTGNVFFEHSGGSLGTLNANGGIVLLGASDALGNATLNLNGGGVQWATNLTVANPINIGANGGMLGATTGFTATIPNNFSTTNACSPRSVLAPPSCRGTWR